MSPCLFVPALCCSAAVTVGSRNTSGPCQTQALVFRTSNIQQLTNGTTQTQISIASGGMLAHSAFHTQCTQASHRACLLSPTGDLVRIIIRICKRCPRTAVQRPGCKTFCLKSVTACLPCMCSTHTLRHGGKRKFSTTGRMCCLCLSSALKGLGPQSSQQAIVEI